MLLYAEFILGPIRKGASMRSQYAVPILTQLGPARALACPEGAA
jgi:hypothetical protein